MTKKINFGLSEMKDHFVIRQLLAEFIGTFVYISITVLAGISLTQNYSTVAFANGLTYASMLQVFGNISGAHFNPAVTLGALICDRIRLCKAVCYIAVQSAGAILGALTTYHLIDPSIRGNLSATVPNAIETTVQAVCLEMLMTFVVVSVFLSVGNFNLTGPLAVGLSVTACLCSAQVLTVSLNPVRSLGPAVVMNIWQEHWVYWFGPLAGGLMAGLIRRAFQWHKMLRPSTEHAHPVTILPREVL